MLEKAIKWVAYIAVIVFGFLAQMSLWQMFGVKNAEYGTPITITSEANQSVVVRYELDYVDFEKQDDGTGYTAEYVFDSVEYNGIENEYFVYFNDLELSDTQTAGTLSSRLIKTFYDTDNEVIANVTINIDIVCTVSATTITLTSDSAGEDMSYFGTYMTLNGATLLISVAN